MSQAVQSYKNFLMQKFSLQTSLQPFFSPISLPLSYLGWWWSVSSGHCKLSWHSWICQTLLWHQLQIWLWPRKDELAVNKQWPFGRQMQTKQCVICQQRGTQIFHADEFMLKIVLLNPSYCFLLESMTWLGWWVHCPTWTTRKDGQPHLLTSARKGYYYITAPTGRGWRRSIVCPSVSPHTCWVSSLPWTWAPWPLPPNTRERDQDKR